MSCKWSCAIYEISRKLFGSTCWYAIWYISSQVCWRYHDTEWGQRCNAWLVISPSGTYVRFIKWIYEQSWVWVSHRARSASAPTSFFDQQKMSVFPGKCLRAGCRSNVAPSGRIPHDLRETASPGQRFASFVDDVGHESIGNSTP